MGYRALKLYPAKIKNLITEDTISIFDGFGDTNIEPLLLKISDLEKSPPIFPENISEIEPYLTDSLLISSNGEWKVSEKFRVDDANWFVAAAKPLDWDISRFFGFWASTKSSTTVGQSLGSFNATYRPPTYGTDNKYVSSYIGNTFPDIYLYCREQQNTGYLLAHTFVVFSETDVRVGGFFLWTGPISDMEIITVEEYTPGGTSGPAGGGGSFTPSPSTDITGSLPNGSFESDSSSTGLFTRYAMTEPELVSLGAALYTDDLLAMIGKEIMSFLWNSPSEALISLISYPFDVSAIISNTPSGIKFGSLDLPAVTGSRLNSSFAQIDWGSIQLSEYWGNFLDYSPHTKIELYLPWCTGTVNIDPHECLPGTISVKTNIEISKGTCVHNVYGNKGALIGCYSGTCGSQLPMSALDNSGKALALVTTVAGAIVSGAAAGGATSAGIAAANSPFTTAAAYSLEQTRGLGVYEARRMATNAAVAQAEAPYRRIQRATTTATVAGAVAALRTPTTIQRNGSFSGNGAGMSIQFPFVILSRPEQNVPANYGNHFGYPSNVFASIGKVKGYTEVGAIHLTGIAGATVDEIEELDSILKGGVIL